jgi:hypothetical protein
MIGMVGYRKHFQYHNGRYQITQHIRFGLRPCPSRHCSQLHHLVICHNPDFFENTHQLYFEDSEKLTPKFVKHLRILRFNIIK